MTHPRLPHIVLVILDSARQDLFGSYGSSRGLTPNCDSLAEEGMVLRNHYSPGCGSAQSHVSIFLGQHPGRHRVVHNLCDYSPDLTPLPLLLQKFGYRAFGHCRASFIPPAGYEGLFGFEEHVYPGHSGKTERGRSLSSRALDSIRSIPPLWTAFKSVYSKIISDRMRVRGAARYFDGRVSIEHLLARLKTHHHGGPIFAYTTLLHPHTPYYPPRRFRRQVLDGRAVPDLTYKIQLDFHAWQNGNYGEAKEALAGMKLLYEANLLYGDHLVGKLVKGLGELGILDDTILIVTSDHGESFGEHGLINHGRGVWQELIRTPCIIRYPARIKSGLPYNNLSSGLDIVPTVLDILGELGQINPNKLDGISWLSEPPSKDDRLLVVDSPPVVLPERLRPYPNIIRTSGLIQRAAITNRFKYIWQSDGERHLFNVNLPELPQHNLIDEETEVALELHDRMVGFYKSFNASFALDEYPVPIGKEVAKKIVDPKVRRELKRLGYL